MSNADKMDIAIATSALAAAVLGIWALVAEGAGDVAAYLALMAVSFALVGGVVRGFEATDNKD